MSIQGIDVSSHQPSVDWNQVLQAGKLFAFLRATDGLDYTDPRFETYWSGALEAGMLRGAYHFYRTNDDPTAQAESFLRVIQLQPGDLPPVVDFEKTTGSESASQILHDLQTWLDVVEKATGRIPVIYTGPDFWSSFGSSGFGRYPLWVAEYGVQSPRPVMGWPAWTFWQYSETGSVPGIPGAVDLDVFQGTLEELRSL
jgi:lysozyme